MKNVITILVDSVFSDCLGKKKTGISSTPFIDSLIEKGIFSDSVYSYGPYTDAATKGLYSGKPSLSEYGYYYGLNSSKSYHFKAFKDNGYETYGFYYPYYLLGSRVRESIDHSIFVGGFDFPAVWFGKYSYYSKRKKENGLSEVEYSLLLNYTDLMFDCWTFFYEEIEKNQESNSIIKTTKIPCSGGKALLLKEKATYLNNKRAYVDSILDSENCILSSINDYVYDGNIDVDWIKENVYKRYATFFRKIEQKQFLMNVKNNHFSVPKMLSSKRYLSNVMLCLFAGKHYKYVSKRPGWQLNASFQRKIDTMFEVLEKRSDNERPFYFSIHTEEPHNYVSFFSYDIQDDQIINEEINYVKPIVEECSKKFKGNLFYQLSLAYVDLCVKRIYDRLKRMNLLENTSIVLMADHGTSYGYDPIRKSVVNNFHLENYKTPFLMWNSDSPAMNGKYDGLYSAADVQATICVANKLILPDDYVGCPLFQMPSGREYVITEYMGPGCPDMISKSVWISIRNKRYCLAFINDIDKPFAMDNLCELYDLKNDPYELKNMKKSVDYLKGDEEFLFLFNRCKERFESIVKGKTAFLDKNANRSYLDWLV